MPKLESQAPKLVNRGGAGLLSKVGIATTNGRAEHIANLLSSAKKNNVRCEGTVVSISSLKPDPDNARLHPERNMEAIKLSLAQFGQLHPIVVRLETRVVMAGNGRLEAAKQLGWSKIAASLIPMTEAEAAAYGLADNRTSELATWDFETVARLDRLVQEAGLEQVGWSAEELTALRMQQSVTPEADPDDVPPVPVVPVSRLGDLWTLGEHRLLCGDAKDSKVIARLLGKIKPTLLFTDPPYGVSVGAKNRLLNSVQKAGRCLDDIQDDEMPPDELKKSLSQAFIAVRPHLADDCSVFICFPLSGELGPMALDMLKDVGLPMRHVIIWRKNSPTFSMGRLDYDYQHEPILFGWKKTHKKRDGGLFTTSIWEVDKPRASPDHATAKPVELPENAVLRHTDPGDVVLDIYMGSGTTMIAAHKHGRRCCGVEIEPRYVDVCLRRWSNYAGQDPVRYDGAKFSELIAERDAGQVEE